MLNNEVSFMKNQVDAATVLAEKRLAATELEKKFHRSTGVQVYRKDIIFLNDTQNEFAAATNHELSRMLREAMEGAFDAYEKLCSKRFLEFRFHLHKSNGGSDAGDSEIGIPADKQPESSPVPKPEEVRHRSTPSIEEVSS